MMTLDRLARLSTLTLSIVISLWLPLHALPEDATIEEFDNESTNASTQSLPKEENLTEALKIVALSTIASIVYGTLHGSITASISPHYAKETSETLYDNIILTGAVHGISEIWLAGLTLGIGLASASRIGSWPKLNWKDLTIPLLLLLSEVGIASTIEGNCAYNAPNIGMIVPRFKHDTQMGKLLSDMKVDENVPVEYKPIFGVSAARTAAYDHAPVAAAVLLGWTLFHRWYRSTKQNNQQAATTANNLQ